MKTKNIYIALLTISKDVQTFGSIENFFNMRSVVKSAPIKFVLVKTRYSLGKGLIAKDLNTNKKYRCQVPLEVGKIFIDKRNLHPFDAIYPDSKPNLSKKKILEMGNKAIDKIEIIKK